jgi:hypothetical protein
MKIDFQASKTVFVPALPVSLIELKHRITTAIATVDRICSGLFGQN